MRVCVYVFVINTIVHRARFSPPSQVPFPVRWGGVWFISMFAALRDIVCELLLPPPKQYDDVNICETPHTTPPTHQAAWFHRPYVVLWSCGPIVVCQPCAVDCGQLLGSPDAACAREQPKWGSRACLDAVVVAGRCWSMSGVTQSG